MYKKYYLQKRVQINQDDAHVYGINPLVQVANDSP